MNPLRIRAQHYRQFAHLDLAIPTGCTSVVGDNGAGKSSLLQAVDIALLAERGELAQWLTTGSEQTELMIEITFEHAGDVFRVRRSYSARGAGKTAVDLERAYLEPCDALGLDGNVWESLTLATAAETQALLERILGFGRVTFRASSFLKQRDGGAFCEATAGKRKEILTAALGLDRFPKLQTAVRRDRRAVENEVERIEGRLAGVTAEALTIVRMAIKARIAHLGAVETESRSDLDLAEAALEQATTAYQAAQTQAAEHTAAVARRDAAVAAHLAHARVREEALVAASALAETKDEIDALPAFDLAALEEREQELALAVQANRDASRERDEAIRLHELRANEKRAIEAQAANATTKARELDAKVVHLEGGTLDTCPTCEQTLGAESRAATVRSLRAQAQLAAEEGETLFERAAAIVLPSIPDVPEVGTQALQLETVRRDLAATRDAGVSRARLMERVRSLSETIMAASSPEYLAELERLGDERETAETALAALPPAENAAALEAAAVRAYSTVEIARAQLGNVQREKAVEQERLAQHAAREEQAAADLAERERHLAQLDRLAILERAYGPSGIPALILENAAIPQIETEANRILLELGAKTAECRIELRTDRAKKDGGIKDDVLDIIVITPDGDRDYSTFSEGEKTRLNLALRLALARLLATRRGAESRLLAIDEPDYLDADGMERLATVLRDLEQSGAFDRVLLVSHFPALRDSFDNVIEVEIEQDGRSRIVGTEVEAVVA